MLVKWDIATEMVEARWEQSQDWIQKIPHWSEMLRHRALGTVIGTHLVLGVVLPS